MVLRAGEKRHWMAFPVRAAGRALIRPDAISVDGGWGRRRRLNFSADPFLNQTLKDAGASNKEFLRPADSARTVDCGSFQSSWKELGREIPEERVSRRWWQALKSLRVAVLESSFPSALAQPTHAVRCFFSKDTNGAAELQEKLHKTAHG